MKKISTAAAQKIEKVEGQQLTIGLDLGDRSSWHCVLNAAVREPNPPISSENSLFVSRPFGQELLLTRTWGRPGGNPPRAVAYGWSILDSNHFRPSAAAPRPSEDYETRA
jgi:hypothetical protein